MRKLQLPIQLSVKGFRTAIFSSVLIFLTCNAGDNENSTQKEITKKDTMMTYQVKIINVSINRSADEVYQFASNPENFPRWVDFVQSIARQGDIWVGKTANGDIKIKFTPQNDFRVIDHQVTLPNGETVNNPMRVLPNNEGSEFVFTLFRLPNRTEKEYNEDAKTVKADLKKLKEIMEGK